MKERMHRFIWLFMAILFVLTALGVGVYAFWQNTHGSGSGSQYIKCSAPLSSEKFSLTSSNASKVKGTKLVGFRSVSSVGYVKCTDFKAGSGAAAQASSTVTVLYSGALANDGTIFDSSVDNGQPLTIALNQVIQGWTAGIPGMKVGGERRLYIPAQYGYGSQAQAGIPADSDLVFDVTLLSVK